MNRIAKKMGSVLKGLSVAVVLSFVLFSGKDTSLHFFVETRALSPETVEIPLLISHPITVSCTNLDMDPRITCFETDSGMIMNTPFGVEPTSSWQEIDEMVYEITLNMDYLTPAIAYGVIKTESSFQSDAFSSANCVGLMQLDPYYNASRMERLGATNLFCPEDNLLVGCTYFDQLLCEYGLDLAIKVYGWGVSNADKPQYQESMQEYIDKVLRYAEEWEENYEDDYERWLLENE